MSFTLTTPKLSIVGGGDFPVRRIYCVGRNYRAHTIEMGGDPDREQPFFFTKPPDAIEPDGATIAYPPMTGDYQHEIELVLAIGGEGQDIPADRASGLIFGYATGLDMTRRDLQAAAKKAGRPWDMAKGFDRSAPCGPISRKSDVGSIEKGAIWLTVNGEMRQSSDISLLIWRAAEVIADLSRYVTLKPGDLVYTGTPDGVGPVKPGDRLHGHIDGLTDLNIAIAL